MSKRVAEDGMVETDEYKNWYSGRSFKVDERVRHFWPVEIGWVKRIYKKKWLGRWYVDLDILGKQGLKTVRASECDTIR
jgi:hypothetical protein